MEYLDRVDIKLLPAIGVFLEPTPDVRFNVYFPRPKLAHRIPNVGNVEIWAYIAGEYGGGSWEISQPIGSDQVDINDIRIYGGIEWTGPRGVTGFLEAGYVFERELMFRAVQIPYDLRDAAMVRAGLAF